MNTHTHTHTHTHLPCAVTAGTRSHPAPQAGEAGPAQERFTGRRALHSLRAPGTRCSGVEAIRRTQEIGINRSQRALTCPQNENQQRIWGWWGSHNQAFNPTWAQNPGIKRPELVLIADCCVCVDV